jgi:flagellar P-ring protein precursor FlgI
MLTRDFARIGAILGYLGAVLCAFAAPTNPLAPAAAGPVEVRIKDIARVQSVRDNQLMGYGLVVGLNGTGDSASSPFAAQALTNMLQHLGAAAPSTKFRSRNVAAVLVTADIGPFLSNGDRMDVTINAVGDCNSLQGGTLLQCPLQGANGKVYAVAQGSISLGGYSAGGGGATKTSGHPTVGRIPSGALIEAEIPMTIVAPGQTTLTFSLQAPDFTTAARVAAAINVKMPDAAKARNAAAVDVDLAKVPAAYAERTVELIADLGQLTVAPDAVARVVINERTGTVVIGGRVKVLPVAVAQGALTVTVNPDMQVSQPFPGSNGKTVAQPTTAVTAEETAVTLTEIRGSTVSELVSALNAMKVSPRDVIAILQSLKQAGSLQAELQIM